MVVKCKNGHWYDGKVYSKCPHCEGNSQPIGNIAVDGAADEDDRTISFGFFGMAETEPVTGWLVCTAGSGRGRDFRLHSGRNFVGRGTDMDVVLEDDNTVSKEKHCSVTYEPKGNAFYLASEGGNTVLLNGEAITHAMMLKRGDKIQLGETELTFVPFCEEGRKWAED